MWGGRKGYNKKPPCGHSCQVWYPIEFRSRGMAFAYLNGRKGGNKKPPYGGSIESGTPKETYSEPPVLKILTGSHSLVYLIFYTGLQIRKQSRSSHRR